MDKLRLAGPQDADACLEIYRPLVEETVISFETTPPETADFRRRIEDTIAVWPWLVHVRDERVTGYAYACRHRARAAYQWCVEVSAYVSSEHRGTGVGRALYGALFECLRYQGFAYAVAGIALPNDASVAFHCSLGFQPVGVYHGIGYKMGAWCDVAWWELRLSQADAPTAPVALAACRGEIEALLAALTG